MSTSESGPVASAAPTSFAVNSDPTVRITIYDATRTMRGQAEGSLRMLLTPGLYRVQFERGGRVHDEIVDHETVTDLRHVGPSLQSPAPFVGPETSRDYAEAAQRLSVTDTARPLGDGPHTSRLFVFVRRAARGGAPRTLPSEPLTIHDVDGCQRAALEADSTAVDHDAGYFTYSVPATPGTYRIRGVRSQRDVAIVVPAGRAAQVFIADTGSVRLAELRLALVPVGARFDPASRIWRAMEGVIAALRAPDRPLPLAARILLPEAIADDLCLGIAAAHVLWRSGDRAGFDDVMQHLAGYRSVPDVAILECLGAGTASHAALRRASAPIADTPPLLRASLTLALTRPEIDPELSAYSAFAHAARTGLPDSVWCTWSTRTWDQRWIEPAVEHLRDREHQRDAVAIGRSLELPRETVERALEALDAAQPAVDGQPLATGQQVSGFTLGKPLGRGARSTVYRARRRDGDQDIALKIVPVAGGATGCERARDALNQAGADNLPRFLAASAQGTLPDHSGIWLEMELCKGSVLDLRPEADAPLPLAEAHHRVLEALAALAALHERGTAHGDIKPGNLLVRADGSLVLAGLDLATRRTMPDDRYEIDAPRLAPPEFLTDDSPPSLASDVWSMAATYYFLLTLEYPREEYADQSELEAARYNDNVPIADRRPDLPPELVRCLDQALKRAPGDRPKNAGAFAEQLAAIDLTKLPVEPSRRTVAPAPAPQPDATTIAIAGGIATVRPDAPRRRWSAAIRDLAVHAYASRPRWLIAGGGVAVAVIGVLAWSLLRQPRTSCAQDARFDDLRHRSEACLASYQQTGNQDDLALAAKAYAAVGDPVRADALAYRLLSDRRDGDAYAILGETALQRHDLNEARRYAALAHDAHAWSRDELQRSDELRLVDDAVLLCRAAWQVPDLGAAWQAAEEAVERARRSNDRHAQVISQLASAEVLRRTGDLAGADAALFQATNLATAPCDGAASHLGRAMLRRDGEQGGQASVELTEATKANRTCGSRAIANEILLQEAWLLRSEARADTSRLRLAGAKLDELARTAGEQPESLLLRGYLAADQGDLAGADRYLERAEQLDGADPGIGWAIAWARAEVAEQLGGGFAEHHYRRSIASIGAMRATARARSAYLLDRYRGPFDGLIALLARQGRWRDVLAVVLELDASDMLRAVATARVTLERARWGEPAFTPGEIAPAVPAVDDVVAAWQGREVVVVVAPSRRRIASGHERAYRVRIADGQVTGEDVGDASLARDLAAELYERPGNRQTARALGAMMIPPGPATGTLHVLALGPLGKAPLAALRDDTGALIIARRPLERILALATAQPAPPRTDRAVIIAAPRGERPGSALEGAIVARALGSDAQRAGSGTGAAATRSVLWSARDADLLHLAGDIVAAPPWRVLRLADGDVEPAELVWRGVAPRIAVLSSNSSAVAMDEEGWGSLASALVQAGTEVVIATDRRISDTDPLLVIPGLYDQPGWRTDPARALARVQRALDAWSSTSVNDESSASSWAAFGVVRRPPYVAPR